MIPKKSLDSVLDKSIILTITAPNDNANQDPVQCAPLFWVNTVVFGDKDNFNSTTYLHCNIEGKCHKVSKLTLSHMSNHPRLA